MHKGRKARKPQKVRASIIRIGDLGNRRSAPRRASAGEDTARTAPERRAWERRYGNEWVEGIQGLASWAMEAGIPIRAGSRALATSPLVLGWGWGGLPEGIGGSQATEWASPASSGPSRPTWILRTAPGWGECVRRRVEQDPRLEARGVAPYLVVEESARVHLPPQPSATAWPGQEAWSRAARLLDLGGAAPPLPSDWGDLLRELRAGAQGRHPLEPEQAWLVAWDLWCAACAWERDRPAWWITRYAEGFVGPEEERRWIRRAMDWGVRILPPSVQTSGVCARREGHHVRLGLDARSRRVREIAPELVRERVHGGSFGSVGELVRRAAYRGAGGLVLAELALTGTFSPVPGLWPAIERSLRLRWAETRRLVAPAPSRAAFSG